MLLFLGLIGMQSMQNIDVHCLRECLQSPFWRLSLQMDSNSTEEVARLFSSQLSVKNEKANTNKEQVVQNSENSLSTRECMKNLFV